MLPTPDAPQQIDLTFRQGQTVAEAVLALDSTGTPVYVGDCTTRAQIRGFGGRLILDLGTHLTISDTAILVNLARGVTGVIPSGVYSWDLWLDQGGASECIAAGAVRVDPAITTPLS